MPGAGFGFSTSSTLPAFGVPAHNFNVVVRRNGGIALAVAEPDHIAVAEHDVVGAGAAVDRLVEVVAHRVVVGEALEVRRVALLHVVEAERRGAFAGGRVGSWANIRC